MELSSFHDQSGRSAGLYIHVPFCVRKCLYCNFFSVTDLSLKQAYIKSLLKEIDFYKERNIVFDSVYFGGGTPSLLSPRDIRLLLKRVRRSLCVSPDAEITMEANPGTDLGKKMGGYYDAGINRINIGVQSFQDENLRLLGRIHSSKKALDAIEHARNAGFENIGIDLIYGLPGQTLRDWEKDLSRAVAYMPEHLSCYMLTYEPETPLGKAAENGSVLPLAENDVARMFTFTLDFLSCRNYPPYEISNFARSEPDDHQKYRSRHNRKYWTFSPYIGIGPSAHSYLHPLRFWNSASVEKYVRKIESGGSAVENSELLTREQQMIEFVFLGLRTSDGIDLKSFEARFGVSFSNTFALPLDRLTTKGFLVVSKDRCAPTFKGMRYHDGVCDLLVRRI